MQLNESPVYPEADVMEQGSDVSILSHIQKPGVAATVWQRDLSVDFSNWIKGLSPENLPQFRSLVTVDALENSVHAACDLSHTPAGKHRDMLAGDIAALGFIMSEIMGSSLLHVRLEVVNTDACRKFHVDNMTARMLCTYLGRGTQIAQRGAESSPVTVSAGDATLLRGARWPGKEETTIQHRSPPIAGTGETRLLLAIDPGSDYKPEIVYN
ncbi:DUF1826 domain-containing protein [Kiloniella litopenaei]|uniref:DUF1826 domain-containing protein n=1 Tax=Kiloniella litopenaei TaxID=1549748 RepID=UPI003BAA357A